MRILSIDTSTKYGVVALSGEEGLIAGRRILFEKGCAEGIFEAMQEVLKKAGLVLEDIDYFGVGIGPGSFTGIRIALSAVKGLSYSLKKPCLGFSSLDAVAFNPVDYKRDSLCVMMDARRSNIYCRFYGILSGGQRGQRHLKRLTQDRLLSCAQLKRKLGSGTVFSGDALKLYQAELVKQGGNFQFVPEEFWYPTPQSLAVLSLDSFKRGPVYDCFSLPALYLYPKNCQVSKKC